MFLTQSVCFVLFLLTHTSINIKGYKCDFLGIYFHSFGNNLAVHSCHFFWSNWHSVHLPHALKEGALWYTKLECDFIQPSRGLVFWSSSVWSKCSMSVSLSIHRYSRKSFPTLYQPYQQGMLLSADGIGWPIWPSNLMWAILTY